MGHVLPPRAVRPGRRWKTALVYKLSSIHKLSQQHVHHIANDDVLFSLSKIDEAHTMLETGVSLKIAGKKICFVAPNLLTIKVITAIADVYANQSVVNLAHLEPNQDALFLVEEDFRDMEESDLRPIFGQWTSLGSCFPRATLADFISREITCADRVAANSRGDIMFFIMRFGPWRPRRDVSIRHETSSDLLRQTVHGSSDNVPVEGRFGRKRKPEPVIVEPPPPLRQ